MKKSDRDNIKLSAQMIAGLVGFQRAILGGNRSTAIVRLKSVKAYMKHLEKQLSANIRIF